jgi:MFS family permease
MSYAAARARHLLWWPGGVVTTYTLACGGLMMLSGRIGEMFGARRLLLVGLVACTAPLLACSLASGPAMSSPEGRCTASAPR